MQNFKALLVVLMRCWKVGSSFPGGSSSAPEAAYTGPAGGSAGVLRGGPPCTSPPRPESTSFAAAAWTASHGTSSASGTGTC